MANLKFKNSSKQWQSLSVVRGPKGDNATINLNGKPLSESSFYAPVSSGLPGQILQSNGADQSPTWVEGKIPTVYNAVLDIRKNKVSIGTFSANARENKVINIDIPVEVGDTEPTDENIFLWVDTGSEEE